MAMKNPVWMLRSKLGWVNFFILQWFFVRLQEVGLTEPDGKWKHLRWELLWAPLPLTGWWSRYVYLYKGPTARRHKSHRKEPNSHLARYVVLKKRLLRSLLYGPKSAYALELHMKKEGFRTTRVIHRALQELVDSGEVAVRQRQDGRPWLYEKAKSSVAS